MKSIKRGAGILAAAAALAGMTMGTASAQSVTGWVGPAGSSYLSTSTIINSPSLTAQSRIYSTFGANAAPGDIGVRARLFKSGVLCEAIDYRYNSNPSPDLTAGTTKTCGTGSYNSHGFVAVWNATNFTYDQYVTFPSNPLNWTAPAAARTASTAPAVAETGTNARGQAYGSADTASASPDLIASYTTTGQVGYVKRTDLDRPAPANPAAAAAAATPTGRTIPVYKTDGTTRIGEFRLN